MGTYVGDGLSCDERDFITNKIYSTSVSVTIGSYIYIYIFLKIFSYISLNFKIIPKSHHIS